MDAAQNPLKLVLVDEARARVEARVYSFETGTWGDIISTAEPCHLTSVPVTVVGNRLYCWLKRPVNSILEFNLDSQTLALITRPPRANLKSRNCRIIPGEDGAVGLALFLYPTIELWNRNINSHGVATWVLCKTVVLDSIFDLAPSSTGTWRSLVLGYAEDANAILISVYKEMCMRVFTVQLESMQCKRIRGHFLNGLYYPFASFYAAGNLLILTLKEAHRSFFFVHGNFMDTFDVIFSLFVDPCMELLVVFFLCHNLIISLCHNLIISPKIYHPILSNLLYHIIDVKVYILSSITI